MAVSIIDEKIESAIANAQTLIHSTRNDTIFAMLYDSDGITVPKEFLRSTVDIPPVQVGHRGDVVDLIDIDQHRIFYGVRMQSNHLARRGNVIPNGTIFRININNDKDYQNLESAEAVREMVATPIKTIRDVIHQSNALPPGATSADIKNIFRQGGFKALGEFIQPQCAIQIPATLREHIQQMKENDSEKLRLIPNATEVKESRWNRDAVNINTDPLLEVKGGRTGSPGIRLSTSSSHGLAIMNDGVIVSGPQHSNTSVDYKPQQITGLPSSPFPLLDIMPKGNVFTPHINRIPWLGWIRAILPIAQAIKLVVAVAKNAKKASGS